MTDPFADFKVETGPKEGAFAKLNDLVLRLNGAEEDVLAAEKELKAAQQRRDQIDQFDIPAYMQELGMAEYTRTDGSKVEVITKIRASVGKRKAQVFAWLVENGHGAMIKRTISVAFNRDQAEDAKMLLTELQDNDKFAGAKQDMKVEAASFTAFVREQLEKGVDLPKEIFGVFEQKSTKITKPKR